jgi:hypothetical protein
MSTDATMAKEASDWFILPKKSLSCYMPILWAKRITCCFLWHYFGNWIGGTIPAYSLGK